MLKAMGIDDYVMIAALIAYTAYLVCQLGGVAYGTGRHIEYLTTENAQAALKYWWFCEVFYAPSTSLLKVSVGLFLLRIVTNRAQKWIVYIFVAGSIIFGSVYFFLIIFQCSPISFWWDLNPERQGTCVSPTAFAICSIIISILNSAADLAFAIVPGIIVWSTTMTTRTRALVCVLLGLASIAGIVTIVRIPYLHTLNSYKGDFLYDTWQVAVLTTLEVGLGITAACAATFRPLVQQWLGPSQRTATRNHVTFTSGQGFRNSGKKDKSKLSGFAAFSAIKSQTVISQHKGGLANEGDKAVIVTTITGRESWSHLPDLELLESEMPLGSNVAPIGESPEEHV